MKITDFTFIVKYIITDSVFQSANVPFRRIREEEFALDPRLTDNSFDAKVTLVTN